ncbi:MAG: hypothetical protein J6C39_02760 [Clostridia bacterium]|nr:hypothetical protein [Clostridia bacterium]MBQ8583387.1 hypothetical protein [Clostridia bacterium]
MEEKYEKIINLPPPTSASHPRMARLDRAAQFAPFAALSGYGDAVAETARLTDRQIELDEGEIERLNRTLTYLSSHLGSTEVLVTYFVPDRRKSGGKYLTERAAVARLDCESGIMTLSCGTDIPFDKILKIEIPGE